MNIYLINYLHPGAPKVWFSISSDSVEAFEELQGEE